MLSVMQDGELAQRLEGARESQGDGDGSLRARRRLFHHGGCHTTHGGAPMRRLTMALALLALAIPAAAQDGGETALTPSEQQLLDALRGLPDLMRQRMAEQEGDLLGSWHAAGLFLLRCMPRVMIETHGQDTLRRVQLRAEQNARVSPQAWTRFMIASQDNEARFLSAPNRMNACQIAAQMIDSAKTYLDETRPR